MWPCFAFLFLASSFTVKKRYVESKVINDSIIATYNYVNKYRTQSVLLKLYKDKSYTFSVWTHMQEEHFSNGTWERKGNSFILNSSIQQHEIPIVVTQSKSNSESEFIKIEDIYNKAGIYLRTIEIMTNYDTSKSCYPTVNDHCKIKRQDIKSIQLKLGDDNTSAWYPIKLNENNNTIKVVVDIDFVPEFYIFFKNKKFIKKGRKLCDVEYNTYFNKGPFKKWKKRKRKNYY